jgi:hypothetical protein
MASGTNPVRAQRESSMGIPLTSCRGYRWIPRQYGSVRYSMELYPNVRLGTAPVSCRLANAERKANEPERVPCDDLSTPSAPSLFPVHPGRAAHRDLADQLIAGNSPITRSRIPRLDTTSSRRLWRLQYQVRAIRLCGPVGSPTDADGAARAGASSDGSSLTGLAARQRFLTGSRPWARP